MKVKSIEIEGLHDSDLNMNLVFNDDINIITGRNGSGKTTVLKLLWYCISGNIERAIKEIEFSKVLVSTSRYNLTVEKQKSKGNEVCRLLIENSEGEIILDRKESLKRNNAVDLANHSTVELFDTSIFFPTFRRIEGGFSITDNSIKYRRRRATQKESEDLFLEGMRNSQIQNALESHANMLSVANHKFVSSISTIDIQKLVTRKHNSATTKVDLYSKSLSEKIFTEIRNYRSSNLSNEDALRDATSTLEKINQDVIEFENIREDSFKSLNVLSNMIVKIFQHKGIKLNPTITLGDIDNSINSDALSAGEKQMLSFLCYNALHNNCPFFIDEPELSLHVDWQRILLDIMIAQGTDNQFFIATHSPFIYSQFEDKEIMLGEDRGFESDQ